MFLSIREKLHLLITFIFFSIRYFIGNKLFIVLCYFLFIFSGMVLQDKIVKIEFVIKKMRTEFEQETLISRKSSNVTTKILIIFGVVIIAIFIMVLITLSKNPNSMPIFEYLKINASECGVNILAVLENKEKSPVYAMIYHFNGTLFGIYEYTLLSGYFISLDINLPSNNRFDIVTQFTFSGFEIKTKKKQIFTGSIIFEKTTLYYELRNNSTNSVILYANITFGQFAKTSKFDQTFYYSFQIKRSKDYSTVASGIWSTNSNFSGETLNINTGDKKIIVGKKCPYRVRIVWADPGTADPICIYYSSAGEIMIA